MGGTHEDLVPLLAGLGELPMTRRGWAGAAELTLTVTAPRCSCAAAGWRPRPHRGTTPALAEALRGLRAGGLSDRACAADLAARLPGAGRAGAGGLLAEALLPDPVAAGLSEVVADAERRWAPVRLGLDVAGELAALPWEALALPGSLTPLALHPLLAVYRQQAADEVPAPSVAGPLRIVIAISAPVTGGGGVLDYERELRNMLAAVRGARQGAAQSADRAFRHHWRDPCGAAAEPAHVLHLSGHGRPGAIELEDDNGNARVVDARGSWPRPSRRADAAGDRAVGVLQRRRRSDGDPSFAAALIGLGRAGGDRH